MKKVKNVKTSINIFTGHSMAQSEFTKSNGLEMAKINQQTYFFIWYHLWGSFSDPLLYLHNVHSYTVEHKILARY